jgi:RimJ/RimL family protein N-acetyltransferase
MPYLVPPWTDSPLPDQPVLTGAQVTLRPWTAADAPVLVEAYADPLIRLWHYRTLSLTEARALVLEWNSSWDGGTAASWAVVDPAGSVVGRAGFRAMSLAAGDAEVAYWTLPAARGHGVAPAAVRVLCRWAFDEIGLHRLELRHAMRNEASCRVASSTGFQVEGLLRSALLHADGWHDLHVHGRVR